MRFSLATVSRSSHRHACLVVKGRYHPLEAVAGPDGQSLPGSVLDVISDWSCCLPRLVWKAVQLLRRDWREHL